MLTLRRYKSDDCQILADLFYDTVHFVNSKDYTEEQLNVWATGYVDLNAWNSSFKEHYTIVAQDGGTIVGFGDIDRTGYLDRLYVHKFYQRQGIASAICDKLESSCECNITTHASITARPFFENRGYRIEKEQYVERHGIFLKNYIMVKIKI